MQREKLKNLHNYLYATYSKDISIEFGDEDDSYYSYIMSRRIILPKLIRSKQTEWSLFAFLHEIGHVLTNTNKMKRCTQEYLATQWAIKEAREIGFNVPKMFLETYQDYIWKWRETSIKHRGKNVPTKEELTLAI